MNESCLLTAKETAAHLRVNLQTVYRWLKAGRLNGIKLGRSVRFHLAEIQRIESSGLRAESPENIKFSGNSAQVHRPRSSFSPIGRSRTVSRQIPKGVKPWHRVRE